jgi:PAS domain S-box-containing protein
MNGTLPQSSALSRFVFAVIASIVSVALELYFQSFFQNAIYLAIGPTVILVAYIAGFIPALVSLALCSMGVWYYLLPPKYSFIIAKPSQAISIFFFATVAAPFAYLITGGKKARKALEEKEKQFAETIDLAATGIAQISLEGRWLSVNQAICRITGYSESELKSKTFLELTYPDDILISLKQASRLLSGEINSYSIEKRYVHRAQKIIWILANVSLKRDTNGRPSNFIVCIDDISEQKAIEEDLKTNSDRLNLALDAGQMSTFDWEIATNHHTWSHRTEELFGFKSGGFHGGLSDIFSHIHPDDRESVKHHLEESLHTRQLYHDEYRVLHQDGAIRWIALRAMPILDSNGKPVRMRGLCWDITERKNIEIALHESAEQFRTLANNIPQMAWMTDSKGKVIWYNARWYEYTGLTTSDVDAIDWEKVLHPEYLERVKAKYFEHIRSGEVWEDTFPMRRSDGQLNWFLSRAVPIKNEKGQIVRWFGTNTDVSERMQIEEKLAKTAHDLEDAIRARDDFLSIASHELKTPMTSLKLQAQLARMQREQGNPSVYSRSRVDSLIDQTERQVDRIVRLVNDMLDISRIRSGRLTITKEPINVCQVVKDVIERLRPNLDESGTPIQFSCHNQDGVLAEWDRFRFEQVVTNLLTNAMRYGNKKPVQVEIIRLPGNKDFGRLFIKDQGKGIAPEFKDRIFDRFERAVSKDEISGLGLGLFITRQIVEAHGGKIWVESAGLDQGSTFIVEFSLIHAFQIHSSRPNKKNKHAA